MTDISKLLETVSENVGALIPLKEPILQIDFSIVSTGVSMRNKETLDLRVYIDAKQKLNEYASLEDYWVDSMPVLQQNIHPGLKAKKMFEMRYAVTSNDRTIVNGCETKPRAAVLDSLKEMIDHYTSTPAEIPLIKRYSGRDDPRAEEFDQRIANEIAFLRENSDALNGMIFHMADELRKIRAHSHKFAEKIIYETKLNGIRDV